MPDILDKRFEKEVQRVLSGQVPNLADGFHLGSYYVPGVNEEVEENPTVLERFLTKMTEGGLQAAERAYLLQHARRLKLATDLQALRIQKRIDRAKEEEERRKKYRRVATLTRKGFHRGEKGKQRVAVVALEENGEGWRRARFVSLFYAETGEIIPIDEDTFEFIKGGTTFQHSILPWCEGTWTTEEFKKKWEKATYKHSTVRFV